MNTKRQTDYSEEQLISGLKRKDKRALELLYDRYTPALFGVIKRIVLEEDIAEEVLHDAFIKIWENGGSYDPGKGRLFTWMLNISRNLAIDKTRSRKYKEMRKTDPIAHNVYTIDSERYTEQSPEDVGVRELLSNLNRDQQLIVDLLYFRGYTQSEVAEEYNIPLGTVKTRTRAALQALRKYIER